MQAATIVRRKLGGGEAQRRGRPRGPRTVRRLFCGVRCAVALRSTLLSGEGDGAEQLRTLAVPSRASPTQAAQSWWDPRPPQPPPGSSDLGGDTPRGGYRRAAAPGPSAASAGTRAGAAASAATWRAPPADSGFPDRSAGGPGDWAPVGGSAAAGRAGGGLRGTGFGAVGPTGSQPEWSPVSVDRGSQETPWESAVGASAADVASVWGRVIDIPGSAAPPPRPGLQLFTGDGAAPRAASPDAAAPAGPPGGAAPYGYRESGLGASSSASYPGAPEYWGGRVEGRSGVAREMRGPQRAGGSGRRVGDAPPSRVQTRRTDGPPPRRRRQPADPGAQAARGAWDQSGGRSLWESAVAEAGETAGRLWADVWPASARGPEPAASSWSWDGGQPGGGSAPRRAPAGPQERPGREWSGAGEPPEPSGAAAGPGLGGAEFGAAEARRRRRARPGRFPAGSPSADEGVDPAAWREALSRWDAGLARTAAGEEDESVAGAARRYWEAIFVPPKGGGGQGGGGGRRADPPWLRALFKTFPFLKAWGGFA